MPEVRGTTDFNGGAYPPSKRHPRKPSRRSSCLAADGRAETDSLTLRDADTVGHRLYAV